MYWLGAPQAPADQDLPFVIHSVNLKDVLGQIQANRINLHLGRLLSNVAFTTTTMWHFDAGEQGPSTSSIEAFASQLGVALEM